MNYIAIAHTAPSEGEPHVCNLLNLYTEYKNQYHFAQPAAAVIVM